MVSARGSESAIRNVTPPSAIDQLTGAEGVIPKFISRRSAPAAHQVVSDEVDAETFAKIDTESCSMKALSSWIMAEKDEGGGGEPWARLNELSTCPLCGIGQLHLN